MKKMIVILSIVLKCTTLLSQNSIDVLTLSEQLGLPSEYKSGLPGKAKENIFNANLKIPVVLSTKNIWYSDVNYFNFQVTSQNQSELPAKTSLNLHGIILQTGVIHRLNDKQSLFMLFVPRLMSDMQNVDDNDFQYGGIFLFENKFHDNLTMRFGASYNQDLFGSYVVPMVYVDWDASSKINISGLLPIYSKISYLVNDKLSVGIHHFGMVTSYKLNDERNKTDYIENNRIELNFFSRYKITENIHAEVRTGYALGRSYAQYHGDDKIDLGFPLYAIGDDRTRLNQDFKNGALFNIRLMYNLPLNK